MITYEKDNIKYNYRAGIILINDKNEILVQNKKKYDFWILPGGRVELLETSEQTIEREMKEELNLTIHPKRVVLVAEIINKKESYHENLIFYLGYLSKSNIKNNDELKCLDDNELKFKWVNIEKLNSINLYPKFLKEIISNIPKEIQYKRIVVY